MNASRAFRILCIAALITSFAAVNTLADSQRYTELPRPDQQLILQGGEWINDLLGTTSTETYNTFSNWGRVILVPVENLNWKQTWTAHFAQGDFFQTEAISDSVRLAQNGSEQYFTTGIYTSTVFDAGRNVDWISSEWTHSGPNYSSVIIEYRTGNIYTPDHTWTDWTRPSLGDWNFWCATRLDTLEVECNSNIGGIESSRYIQYRASFISYDSAQSVSLKDIRLLYGIHPPYGTATSELLSPTDLLAWDSAVISSTILANTNLVIDVQAPDGTVLVPDIKTGNSLAGINPHEHPSIRLHATFTTLDESLSPELDLWGVRWSVISKVYLPSIVR